MPRTTTFTLLLLALGCSGGEDPSVSEAPYPASAEETESGSKSYLLRKDGGLEVEVLREGRGRPVRSGDWVTVHYRGSIVAGEQVFGDTFKSGVPFSVFLRRGKVIVGWERALAGLRVGTRAVLRIPAALAYGEMGLPGAGIPPGADLSYEIEILDTAARPGQK